MLPKRIYLIGMPGAGKSHVGKHLASELKYDFIDLDDRIEEVEQEKITEIFGNKGEEYFRQVEQRELKAIKEEHLVISTGGGAPCFYDNMKWMKENGFTIFVNRPLDVIIERTSGRSHRPLLKEDPEKTVRELYESRLNMYRQAHMEFTQTEPDMILQELRAFSDKSNPD